MTEKYPEMPAEEYKRKIFAILNHVQEEEILRYLYIVTNEKVCEYYKQKQGGDSECQMLNG